MHHETLHVVIPMNNYIRFKRRYQLFYAFEQRLQSIPNIKVYIVEIAFGDRPFMVTEPGRNDHLQLRTTMELWHKENSINLMIQRLPHDWKYVAWIDADIQFVNPNFALETIEQLQHHQVVQMFQTVANLGPNDEIISTYKSFAHQYSKGIPYETAKQYEFPHPGFAWAMRRDAYDQIGGLLDIGILGACDHHMALCFIDKGHLSLPSHISEGYKRRVTVFQEACKRIIKKNIGCVPGTILHYWHGKFKDRKYIERWTIITKNNFDPDLHLFRNAYGLYQINQDLTELRDGIRRYFKQRNEDSIDHE